MRKLLLLLSVLNFGIVYSQDTNCADKQKEITDLSSEKDYTNATIVLKEILKKCPAFSEKNYFLGIEILQYNIDLSTDENRESAVNDFVKLLDQYDSNFPNNKNGNTVKKAMTLYNNKVGEEKEVFNLLDKAFNKDKTQFIDANAIFTYFKLFNDQVLDKSKKLSDNDLIDKYNQVLFLLEDVSKAYSDKSTDFKNATYATKALMKEYLTPEKLIAYAETNFDKNSSNTVWLESTLQLLNEKSTAKPIFGKLAETLNQLKPSSKSAYYLGEFNLKNLKIDQGLNYFQEAINSSNDKIEKAKIAYVMATIYANSDKAKSRERVKLAIENDLQNGKYFIFLANLYANSVQDCGPDKEQINGIYKLASNTVLKAGVVDPKLKDIADQLSKKYLSLMTNQKQKSVQINCWINEAVQF
jgi:tetratricopeptide (TPR) repeat protein